MIKPFLFRGVRISIVLLALAFIALFVVFYSSPDIKSFTAFVELKVKKEFQTEQFETSNLKLAWDEGPVIDLGHISLETASFSVFDSYAQLSYSFLDIFTGDYAPKLKLRGGSLALNLDIEQEKKSDSANLFIALDDVQLNWTLKQEQQTFDHVVATVSPDYDDISFKADGVDLHVALGGQGQLEELQLKMDNFSGLPKSWLKYVTNMQRFEIDVHKFDKQAWQWKLAVRADDGQLLVPEAHLTVPVSTLNSEGKLLLQGSKEPRLKQLQATSFQWNDGENFGDFILNWQNDNLHIEAKDGSTTMPMLWSWLWLLGDDEWHQWLNSMQHGRLDSVDATLDLAWQDPLHTVPTSENLQQMKYHVTTRAFGADIALGLNGDFLYNVDAYVEIDQEHLEAKIGSAELNKGVGTVSGDYAITWNDLMMDIQAQGNVDLGKLHAWLEPKSAKDLHWGKSPSTATLSMKWDVNKTAPDMAKAEVKPTKSLWHLKPFGSPVTVREGTAVWDINKGLSLDNLKVDTPWFKGDFHLFLNEHWSLNRVSLDGSGSLAQLTEQFALPIVKPEGTTKLKVNFKRGKWSGNLNFKQSDWESFAGYDKKGKEKLTVNFSGKPTGPSVLPIYIEHLDSLHQGFKFESSILIDKKKLDFQFENIETAALRADLRLLVPLNRKLPWGLEVNADYIERPVLQKYLKDVDKDSKLLSRPWNIIGDSDWVAWGESYAEDVHLQLSSTNEQKRGSFTTGYVATADVDLEQIKGSFTKLKSGKIELHHIDANSSGQHVIVSGSATPQKSGVIAWQGMILMDGEFGRLMKQAELDQLFKEGEMNSLLLGKGMFKDGEPWWRGLKGSFRLRVDDGRIMEGGTLTHLLAAISILDLPKYLALKRKDVVGEGLFYDKMQIEAEFDSEILKIKQLAIKSSALDAGGEGKVNLKTGDLDILLVVRPWQNIEAIIGSIPLVGYVLTGEDKSFLRKVYHIHGPASDADVDELDPEDAGLPRSGLLESLFSLPSQLLGD